MWNVAPEMGQPEVALSSRDLRRTSGSSRASDITGPPSSPLPPPGLIENPLFEGTSTASNVANSNTGATQTVSGNNLSVGANAHRGSVGAHPNCRLSSIGGIGMNPLAGPSHVSGSISHPATVSRQASEPTPVARKVVQERRSTSNQARPTSATLRRANTVKEYVVRSTTCFFGVNNDTEENSYQIWTERRKRLLSKRYGKLKDSYNHPSAAPPLQSSAPMPHHVAAEIQQQHQQQQQQQQSQLIRRATPSNLRCSYTPASSSLHPHPVVSGGGILHHHSQPSHQSMGLAGVTEPYGGIDDVDRPVARVSSVAASTASTSSLRERQPTRRKDSVYRLTWDGMVFLKTMAKKRWSSHKSGGRPSVAGRQLSSYAASEGDDNVFLDDTGSSRIDVTATGLPKAQLPNTEENFFDRSTWESGSGLAGASGGGVGITGTTSIPLAMSSSRNSFSHQLPSFYPLHTPQHHPALGQPLGHRDHLEPWYGRVSQTPPPPHLPNPSSTPTPSPTSLPQVPRIAASTPPLIQSGPGNNNQSLPNLGGGGGTTASARASGKLEPDFWQRPSSSEVDSLLRTTDIGMKRIWNRILDHAFDNSDRRQYGMGIVGKFFNRRFRRDRLTSDVRSQLDDIDDHRPYFTYWVTTVQILITLITLAVYGFGPWGFHRTQRSSLVLVTSLSLQQVDYYEPDNFWLGPRSADLVHLGAKFTPCMRRDRNVFDEITKEREQERNTACCVRNDQSGCVQTSRNKCSERISSWQKWDPRKPGPRRWVSDPKQLNNRSGNHRLSGSVCGQDPRYCEEPASVFPYEWPDDITKWPVCRRTVVSQKAAEAHMTCEVIGRPCCIGILGECRITTKEYCDFVKGFFHEEAALCSQVSCLDNVCGMIPFYASDVPDQFYRLWTSLFLHAGLIHLVVTVIVQYLIMRDLEKLIGPIRIAIIYIMSGIAGNLASAIFVPYRAEVGPAGSQFGLLACLLVEVIHCWQMLQKPGMALLRLGGVALAFFLIGTLPWVDNYAHLFGFIFSFLLSYALLPFVSFGTYDRTIKVILIWVCLTVVLALFTGLLVLFYVNPIYECSFCKYFNCVPLTRDFCENQDIVFTPRLEF